MHLTAQWMLDYVLYARKIGRPLTSVKHIETLEDMEAWLVEHAEWHVMDEETSQGVWYLGDKTHYTH